MTTKKTTKKTTKLRTPKPRTPKPAPIITPATLYRANGTSETVLPTNGNRFTLEALQGYVDGNIELLYSADRGTIMVVNEEGLLKKLPPNEKATNWAMREGASYSVIVGNTVIMNANQIR